MRTYISAAILSLFGLISAVPPATAQLSAPVPLTAQQIRQRLERDLAAVRDTEAEDATRAGCLNAVMAAKTFLAPAQKLALLFSLLRRPTPADLALQSWVIFDLAQYGPKAAAAEPALLKILANPDIDSDVRLLTVRTLGAIGARTPGVVPALISVLGDETADPDLSAVPAALGQLGTAAQAAVPALIKTLLTAARGSAGARYAAFVALGKISRGSNTTPVPTLIQRLQRLDGLAPGQASAVFLALQFDKHRASAAGPMLVQIISGKAPDYVRAAALETLSRIGPSAAATRALLRLCRELPDGAPDETFLWETANAALTRLGPGDVDTVGPLIQALLKTEAPPEDRPAQGVPRFRDVYLHGEIISALARIGPPASGAAPILIGELVTSGEGDRRIQLMQAILRVGIPDESSLRRTLLTAVMPSLREGEGIEFATAAYAAGMLGTEASSAVPLLLGGLAPAVLDDGFQGEKGQYSFGDKVTSSVRIEAMRALARIGPAAVDAVPRLQEFALGTPLDVDWLPPTGLHEDVEARKALKQIRGF